MRHTFVARAPRPLVHAVAQLLARGHTLRLEPGWRFDPGADDHRFATELRRDLWRRYRDARIDEPVVFRWYDGLRIRLFLGNDLSLCLYVGGSFEPNELSFLGAVLEPGMVVVDGGANDGLYTLFAARRVTPSGHVLAVEPSPREVERLSSNLALNRITNASVLNVALGATDGTATLAVAEAGHEGQNTIGARVSNPKVETAAHVTVTVETLDRIVEREKLERLDLVKLDVEGSEVEALRGGGTALARFRPLMLLEAEEERLASQNRTKADLVACLADLDYALWVFDGATAQLRPARMPDEPEGNAVAAPRGWQPPRF